MPISTCNVVYKSGKQIHNDNEHASNSSVLECLNSLEKPIFLKSTSTKAKTNFKTPIDNEYAHKRTRLDAFLYKDKSKIKITPPKDSNSDDFETPDIKTNKIAPQKKKPRPKRQQKLQQAFYKNEKLFYEIAAQHCMADNFNPDEVQMALAMSKSEAETSGILMDTDEYVCNSSSNTNNVKKKLQTYGFRTADNHGNYYATFICF